jgi:hypothetical protein
MIIALKLLVLLVIQIPQSANQKNLGRGGLNSLSKMTAKEKQSKMGNYL